MSVVAPEPPLPTGRVPVTPVDNGRPVALVNTAAEGVPRLGVVSAGEVANTNAPLPVSFVTADARLALEGVARNVATPVPRPLTPVEIGNPVAFVNTPADGVPKSGVTRAGDVAKTIAPVPVSSVTAALAFALDGVARKVATPVPRPETPVLMGRPVAFVSVPLDGVPSAGVTSVGELLNTTVEPDPVVVAAEMAVPLPARTGLLMVVVSVSVGLAALPSDVPASPFAVATDTVDTVPPPEK